jgi:hypothetical protein
MSEVVLHTPDKNAVDWNELADQVFPAEALRTTRQRTIQWQWSKMDSDSSA